METFLTVFFGLFFIIIIHELGHFLSAKFFGVKVEEFGLGFPPRLYGKKIGETIYSINWIPFGGFVKILGELPEVEKDEKEQTAPLSPENKIEIDILKESVSEDGISVLEEKIIISKENSQSIKKSVRFNEQKIWKRATVISAGVIANVIFAWLLLSSIFMVGAKSAILVGSVSPSSPAESAGLLAGDRILDFENSEKFISFLAENEGKNVSLKVERKGETLTLSVFSRKNVAPGEGRIGASLVDTGIEKTSFLRSFSESAKFTFSSVVSIFSAFALMLKNIFTGVVPDVVGPVGIFNLASVVGQNGFLYIVHLLSIISLNLAVLNILPFPALDGGRLLFLLIEKIKGAPLSPKFEVVANAAGFSLLLLLMVLVTISDLIRLF